MLSLEGGLAEDEVVGGVMAQPSQTRLAGLRGLTAALGQN